MGLAKCDVNIALTTVDQHGLVAGQQYKESTPPQSPLTEIFSVLSGQKELTTCG